MKINKIYLGDNLDLLKQLDDNSIDSCVSDFPYNLGFMVKKWDTIENYYQWCNDRAKELYRVLKPGAFCLIFSGTRTQHRMVCGFEDAGFEIKDQIMWVYSQGFPKSLNIKKKFEKDNKCKLDKINAFNVEKNLNQSGDLIEMDGLDSVVEIALPIFKGEAKLEFANNVDENFTLKNLMQKELTGEKRGVFVVNNVRQNGKNNLLAKIILIGAEEDLLGQMDMFLLESTEKIDWNMMLLWRKVLEEELKKGKTSITLMELEKIIGLKIFNCLQYQNTLNSMLTVNQTALKPTHEPIMLAQKPIEKNYCYNVQKWGVGGLNIDGSRIELNGEIVPINVLEKWSGFGEEDKPDYEATVNHKGRYPANTIFDETAGRILDAQTGTLTSGKCDNGFIGAYSANLYGKYANNLINPETVYGDSGGASRFFYCAKASQKERTENKRIENKHPTIKPISLIKHLVKLVTPPNGTCIDICEGAGSHALACIELTRESYAVNYIGFENDEESVELANKRIEIH